MGTNLLPLANAFILPLLTAISTTMVIMAIKERTPLYKQLSFLCICMVFYATFSFLQLFYYQTIYIAYIKDAYSVLSDVSRFVLLASWLRLLGILFDNEKLLTPKANYVFTFLYAIMYEIIIVSACTGPKEALENIMSYPASRWSIIVLVFIYNFWVIIHSIRFFMHERNSSISKQQEKVAKLFTITLIIYMFWMCLQDCVFILSEMWNPLFFFKLDPLIWIYGIFRNK